MPRRAQPGHLPLVEFVSSGQCCSKYLSLFNCCVDMLPSPSCFFLIRIFRFGQLSECHHCQLILVVISHSFDCYVIVVVVTIMSLILTLLLFDCCIIVVIVIFVVLGISSLYV